MTGRIFRQERIDGGLNGVAALVIRARIIAERDDIMLNLLPAGMICRFLGCLRLLLQNGLFTQRLRPARDFLDNCLDYPFRVQIEAVIRATNQRLDVGVILRRDIVEILVPGPAPESGCGAGVHAGELEHVAGGDRAIGFNLFPAVEAIETG